MDLDIYSNSIQFSQIDAAVFLGYLMSMVGFYFSLWSSHLFFIAAFQSWSKNNNINCVRMELINRWYGAIYIKMNRN